MATKQIPDEVDKKCEADALVIGCGVLHAYFIFDVADTIDLGQLDELDTKRLTTAPLDLHSVASPGYIQFSVPPLTADLAKQTLENREAQVRLKLYDYGIVAIRFSFMLSGPLPDFAETTRQLRQSKALWERAEELLNSTLKQIAEALNKPHQHRTEDYFVIEINEISPLQSLECLLEKHRREISCLLLGESRSLTRAEEDETVRIRFSYFETDLVIVQWDAALIFDSHEGAEAVESILEFANTQLVELRTYDARLDAELDDIYKWNLTRSKPSPLFRRASKERTDSLRSLIVDIRELADRSNNALKIIGDAFYARLYRGIAARFGLNDWQQQIESKLRAVDEVYRFANDQAQHTRSEFLEIVIIVLILSEILLGLLKTAS